MRPRELVHDPARIRDRGVPDDRWRGGRRVPRPARPAMGQLNRIHEELRRRRTGLVGDASWLAVPRLPRFRGRVYLQVRHLLAVVSSLVGMGFFTEASLTTSAYARFAALHLPVTGDPVADAARWWVEWNHRALPHTHRWWRLEDLDASIAGIVGDDVGLPVPAEILESLAVPVANTAEQRGHGRSAVELSDIPVGVRDPLCRLAERFGYEL